MPATRAIAVRTAQVTKARSQRRDPVAGDDPAAVGGGEQVAAAEAGLEVAGDAEAGEDAAEGRRLQQHEDVLEGGVAGREVEAGHVADGGEPAGEGGEEEEREDQRRDQQRFVGEEVVDAAPGDRAGDGAEAAAGGRGARRRSRAHQPRLQGARRAEHPERQEGEGDAEAEGDLARLPAFDQQRAERLQQVGDRVDRRRRCGTRRSGSGSAAAPSRRGRGRRRRPGRGPGPLRRSRSAGRRRGRSCRRRR